MVRARHPIFSQKVIITHANKCLKDMPLAADITINSTFMDDTIKSNDTEQELVTIFKDMPGIFKRINMTIQTFYSNCTVALKTLDSSLLSSKVVVEDKDSVFEANKVLDMVWHAGTDCLSYSAKFKHLDEFI
jgi:N-acetyl-anhydromuramyl-L-alanine amidase AmpD